MAFWSYLGLAWAAAPGFRGLPADVEQARFAWQRAVECTGWEASAHAEVWIERVDPGFGYAGRAWVDSGGLFHVQLRPDVRHPAVLWHEIAHAWATGHPETLSEGRAELLASCIGGSTPAVGRAREEGIAGGPPAGLIGWTNDLRAPEEERRAAYAAATQLVVEVAREVPLPDLFPQRGRADWAWFEALVRDQGPSSVGFWRTVAILGPTSALWDLDDDGLSNRSEVMLGTNPVEWDTDGDGWADGTSPPDPEAVPLAPHGDWSCSGWAVGERPTTVVFEPGPTVPQGSLVNLGYGDGKPGSYAPTGTTLPAGRPVMVRVQWPSDADRAHGPYGWLRGKGLVLDPGCRAALPRLTWGLQQAYSEEKFASALVEAMEKANTVLGPAAQRLEVEAGFDGVTRWEDGVVVLGADMLPAWSQRRYDVVAAHAVAMHRVWASRDILADLHLVESLSWAITDDPVLTDMSPYNTGEWIEAALRCDAGWWGVVNGLCEAPSSR